jgi:hypothetical protein
VTVSLLYPFLLFFFETITLSPFKCCNTLASTEAPSIAGAPKVMLPLSNKRTLSKEIFEPSSLDGEHKPLSLCLL